MRPSSFLRGSKEAALVVTDRRHRRRLCGVAPDTSPWPPNLTRYCWPYAAAEGEGHLAALWHLVSLTPQPRFAGPIKMQLLSRLSLCLMVLCASASLVASSGNATWGDANAALARCTLPYRLRRRLAASIVAPRCCYNLPAVQMPNLTIYCSRSGDVAREQCFG